jgi:predicted Zn-ribbon and HTH transcriptional regulator
MSNSPIGFVADLVRIVFDIDRQPLYECRNCGSKIKSERSACPNCESDEIAEYDL